MLVSRRVALVGTGAALLGACSSPSGEGAKGHAGGSGVRPLVMGDPVEPTGFSPVNGYGILGLAPLYDGLVRPHSTSDDKLPEFRPALAVATPRASPDGSTWTVQCRDAVTFHDGTPFTAADVAATYEAALDPAVASPLSADLSMLDRVTTRGRQVVFHMKYPYAQFVSLLTQAIAPARLVGSGPADQSPLNSAPVGTGPYRLKSRTSEQVVLESNPSYYGAAPAVKTVTRLFIADDNARAQRIAAGELDGTALPPALAHSLGRRAGFDVVTAKSADWRAVQLPATPFTSDPRVRIALNHAVDRDQIVKTVLDGAGQAVSFPLPTAYADLMDAEVGFTYDPAKAGQLLDAAGFLRGRDGWRRRGDTPAELELFYPASDTVRRDLAAAFVGFAKNVGVKVALRGSTWDAVEADLPHLALLLGGGERPWTADHILYPALHRRTASTLSPYANPGNIGNARIDAALDRARRDSSNAANDYKTVQREFMDDPNAVYLALLHHTYVAREGTYRAGPLLMEPHGHDITYGPWWDVAAWR